MSACICNLEWLYGTQNQSVGVQQRFADLQAQGQNLSAACFDLEAEEAPLLCRQQSLGGWCLCWPQHLPVEAPLVIRVTHQEPC